MKLVFLLSVLVQLPTTQSLELSYKENKELQETCGKYPQPGLIQKSYGGSFVKIADYPYAIRTGIGCSGTLISQRHVLTATHCIFVRGAKTPTQEFVRENVTQIFFNLQCSTSGCDFSAKTVRVVVGDKIILPDVREVAPLYADLAIIELPEKIDIVPICIPKPSSKLQNSVFVVGYGRDVAHNSASPLKKVYLKPIFEDVFNIFYTYDNGMQSPDKGDSGGGAYQWNSDERLEVVSIVSRAPVINNKVQNYTKITDMQVDIRKYSDWICLHTGICSGKQQIEMEVANIIKAKILKPQEFFSNETKHF